MPDGRPDFGALAIRADQQAKQADLARLAALWRELAGTYRELAAHRSTRERENLPAAIPGAAGGGAGGSVPDKLTAWSPGRGSELSRPQGGA